jgi:hypothetical protein
MNNNKIKIIKSISIWLKHALLQLLGLSIKITDIIHLLNKIINKIKFLSLHYHKNQKD